MQLIDSGFNEQNFVDNFKNERIIYFVTFTGILCVSQPDRCAKFPYLPFLSHHVVQAGLKRLPRPP